MKNSKKELFPIEISRWERGEFEWRKVEDTVELDPGIKDLVIGLRGLGFETTGSCEGHLGRSFNYYPQVDIDTDPGPNDGISIFSYLWFLMNKILDARNRKKTREVPWIFISNGCYMTLKPEDVSLSLQKLQEEAKAFGIWLRCLSDKSIERIKGKAYLEYEEAEEEFYKESYDE